MNPQSCATLLLYIQRGLGIVPTTGAEWQMIVQTLQVLEGVANGQFVAEVKAKNAAPVAEAAAEAPTIQ